MENNQIKCPQCDTEINVNDILYRQLQEQIEKEYKKKQTDQNKEFEKKSSELKAMQDGIAKRESNLQEEIDVGVLARLNNSKKEMETRIRKQITDEKSEEINSYKEQLDAKITETRDFNKLKAEFEITKREKEDLQEKYEAEAQQKISAEKEKIKKELEEKSELIIAEKEHVIEQLMDQLKQAQLKGEQRSNQIIGEVLEISLENYLKENFPLDDIEEIKKGSRGADCIQIINTRERLSCGSIYYESKRTKDFQIGWIEKFKTDMREKNVTFGVLITEVYPKGMERLGQRDGVWICSYSEAKGLCFVLREAALLLNTASHVHENKGGKMELLYSYLTGNEFKSQIEAIVEGFSDMNNDLEKEKRAMESIWKKREKQIQKVLLNTSHMYSTVKGIAGSAISEIKALELNDD